VPVEFLQFGGDIVADELKGIIEYVWATGKWPEDWTSSTFGPL